jgi:hypothetical protein
MKSKPGSKVYARLRAAGASLERLDLERALSGDPHLGRAVEERIVWRELLDLELQDFDGQIQCICERPRRKALCK